MTTAMNTLLVPTIRAIATDGGEAMLTLPGTLAALAADRIATFPALRAHQRHAWHAFLSLLAANALHRAGLSALPTGEGEWCRLLRALTPDDADDAPWSLVAPIDRPALLQPPLPKGARDDLTSPVATPDELDMLVTSRNHDLKQAVMAAAAPEDWLFALVALQTMDGFLGAGNYGISRMNGGFANRAGLGIEPAGGPGARLVRDVRRLLALRGSLPGATGYKPEGGLALVWLAPWDGTTSLRREALDEWYIDICRRVRLIEKDGRLAARRGTSKAARVAQTEGGLTGDPWAPVVSKAGAFKVFTPDAGGFGYRRMVDLMFKGEISPAPLQEPVATDDALGLQLVARALVRGQGKTEGYHERRVPLSRATVRRQIGEGPDADPAAAIARERVGQAGEMQGRVLKPALLALFQNGPEAIKFDDKESNRKAAVLLRRFDAAVDARFFERLWQETDEDDEARRRAIRKQWLTELRDLARALLREAEGAGARSSRRRYRATSRAADKFDAGFRINKAIRPYFEKATPDE